MPRDVEAREEGRTRWRQQWQKVGVCSPGEGQSEDRKVVLFDFTSIPNILDDSERSEQEDGRAGKRKRPTQAFLR